MLKSLKTILLCAVLCILSFTLFADEMLTGEEYINRVKNFSHSKNIKSLYKDPKTGTGFVEVRGTVLNIFEFGEDKYFTLHLQNASENDPISYIYINLPENTEFKDIQNQDIVCMLKWDIITLSNNTANFSPMNTNDHYDIEFFAYLPAVSAIEEEIRSKTNIRQYGKPAEFVMPQLLATPKEISSGQIQNQQYTATNSGRLKVYKIIKSVNSKLSDNLAVAYTDFIISYSLGHGVDPIFACAIIAQESHFKNSATSKAGAQGLGQIMPRTAKGLGISNSYDPQQNIYGTTKYIKNAASLLFKKKAKDLTFGELKLVAASYNAGVNAVKKYHDVPPYSETKKYVVKVLNNYVKFLNI